MDIPEDSFISSVEHRNYDSPVAVVRWMSFDGGATEIHYRDKNEIEMIGMIIRQQMGSLTHSVIDRLAYLRELSNLSAEQRHAR